MFTTFCESHTSQVPFHAVARLLRAATGVEGLDEYDGRDRVRDRAKRGDHDLAIPPMRKSRDDLFDEAQFAYCVAATGVLVDTLLNRGGEGGIREAGAAIDRMADAPGGDGLVIREIMLLRLGALLARAHGDDKKYRDYRDRYRASDIPELRGT